MDILVLVLFLQMSSQLVHLYPTYINFNYQNRLICRLHDDLYHCDQLWVVFHKNWYFTLLVYQYILYFEIYYYYFHFWLFSIIKGNNDNNNDRILEYVFWIFSGICSSFPYIDKRKKNLLFLLLSNSKKFFFHWSIRTRNSLLNNRINSFL